MTALAVYLPGFGEGSVLYPCLMLSLWPGALGLMRLGRVSSQFRNVAVGGPVVGRLRADLSSGEGRSVHLLKDASVSGIILQRRRLVCVLSVLDGITGNGFSISRSLEFGDQWEAVVCGLCKSLVLALRLNMTALVPSCMRLSFIVRML